MSRQPSNGRAVAALLLVLAMVLAFSSCKVGPNYVKPQLPLAPMYSEALPAAPGWKTAQPQEDKLRGDWWALFADSELAALEVQVPQANPNVRAAEANLRQARAAIRINRADLFPFVGTSPVLSNNRVSANNPAGAPGARGRTFGTFTLPLQVSYEADLWGRIRRNITSAREQFQASAADLETVKLSLQAELAGNFFQARLLDAQKEILGNNVAAFQKAFELTTNRYNGGIASKAEVAQAETQLRQTEAQLIDVDQARAQFNHAIAVLIGKNPEEYQLPVSPWKQPPPAVPVGLPSELLERRPDIAFAERRMASANEQIGIAKAAFFPQLLITATGGLQAGRVADWFNWPSRYWAVGPQVTQFIFDAGRRRAQVESAQAGYDSAAANYQDAALTAFREVEDSLAALRVLEQESAKQHEAVVSAESSVQLALNRYKGGLVTYLEVITAQSIALNNQRAEVDLLRRRMDATVLLIRALGGGWDTSKLPQG